METRTPGGRGANIRQSAPWRAPPPRSSRPPDARHRRPAPESSPALRRPAVAAARPARYAHHHRCRYHALPVHCVPDRAPLGNEVVRARDHPQPIMPAMTHQTLGWRDFAGWLIDQALTTQMVSDARRCARRRPYISTPNADPALNAGYCPRLRCSLRVRRAAICVCPRRVAALNAAGDQQLFSFIDHPAYHESDTNSYRLHLRANCCRSAMVSAGALGW